MQYPSFDIHRVTRDPAAPLERDTQANHCAFSSPSHGGDEAGCPARGDDTASLLCTLGSCRVSMATGRKDALSCPKRYAG